MILFKSSNILLNNKKIKGSIVVDGNFIKDILPYNFKPSNNIKLIDLKNLWVICGMVDCHTHFKLKVGEGKYNCDDFVSGSKACIAGGITTYIDFTDGEKKTIKADLERKLLQSRASFADYSFHCVIKNIDKEQELKKKLIEVKKLGLNSIKIFTTYKSRGLKIDELLLPFVLKYAKEFDIVVCIHSESDEIINYNYSKYLKYQNRIDYHAKIRDEFSEVYEVSKILKLNEKFNAKIYFVHISSFKSLKIIQKYKNMGFSVYAETCPQYFIFDENIYKRKDNYLYTFIPPVRDKNNKMMMIENLKYFDTIASDSCAFNKSEKMKYKNDLSKIPMGIASSQILFPLVYTYGVKTKKISLFDMVRLLSKKPCEIFLLNKKGDIRKGYYADFCVFDPDERFIVSYKDLNHNLDYSPYDGLLLYGKVKMSVLRGRIIYNDGIFSSPVGMFIKNNFSRF